MSLPKNGSKTRNNTLHRLTILNDHDRSISKTTSPDAKPRKYHSSIPDIHNTSTNMMTKHRREYSLLQEENKQMNSFMGVNTIFNKDNGINSSMIDLTTNNPRLRMKSSKKITKNSISFLTGITDTSIEDNSHRNTDSKIETRKIRLSLSPLKSLKPIDINKTKKHLKFISGDEPLQSYANTRKSVDHSTESNRKTNRNVKPKFILRHFNHPITHLLNRKDNIYLNTTTTAINTNTSRNSSLKFEDNSKKYKFFIAKGNNSDLVRSVMKKRNWFNEVKESSSSVNLIWQPTSRTIIFDRLHIDSIFNHKQMVNHFEYHAEITTKIGLMKNLQSYCESNQIELFDIMPLTFIIDMDNNDYKQQLQQFYKVFNLLESKIYEYHESNSYSGIRERSNIQIQYEDIEFSKRKSKSPNHKKPQSPQSYSQRYTYSRPKIHDTFFKGSNIWLIKPNDYNQGRGINLFNSLEKFKEYLNSPFEQQQQHQLELAQLLDTGRDSVLNNYEYQNYGNEMTFRNNNNSLPTSQDSRRPIENNNGKYQVKSNHAKPKKFIIQKYMESPLLLMRRKFDIRVYVLIDQDMNVYFFKEGYLKLSSEPFTIEQFAVDNKFIHLTNNAIQKYGVTYGIYENGNQWSFHIFEEYLSNNHEDIDFKGKIIPKMKEIIMHSISSVRYKLNQNHRKYCFEIFGYDFMIDSQAKVWLIEVNTNPSLEESSDILRAVLPRMLDDAFKITVDNIFKPIGKKVTEDQSDYIRSMISSVHSNTRDYESSGYKLNGYSHDENLWELLSDNGTNFKTQRKRL